jgi:hypothetical protein
MLGEEYVWADNFGKLKQSLPAFDASAFKRLTRSLAVEVDEIAEKQHSIVPVVEFADILANGGKIPSSSLAKIKKRGVVVVRNVVNSSEALKWKEDVKQYAQRNPTHKGFPKEDPQVLELYWSKPQVQARQHPNMHATMLALGRLFVAGSGEHVDFDHVFTYGERLRMRKPGDTSFNLGPHIDGGSIERFEDEHYQQNYRDIFEGRWEDYDPWRADQRSKVDPNRYREEGKPNGGASVVRAFQGWIALSNIGPVPNAGTLKVLPLLKEATAFVLQVRRHYQLTMPHIHYMENTASFVTMTAHADCICPLFLQRPFTEGVPANDFCGAIPGKSHDLSQKWHEALMRAVVPIPNVSPLFGSTRADMPPSAAGVAR